MELKLNGNTDEIATSLKYLISKHSSKPTTSIYKSLIYEIETHYDNINANTIAKVRIRDDKRKKGLIWEVFCLLYLQTDSRYTKVWLLKDVPAEIATTLNLSNTKDMGIDIICESKTGYIAVQCKYKISTAYRNNSIPFKQLSTFYALCRASPLIKKSILMATVKYKPRGMPRVKGDSFILEDVFINLCLERWLKIAGIYTPHSLSSVTEGDEGITVDLNNEIDAGNIDNNEALLDDAKVEEKEVINRSTKKVNNGIAKKRNNYKKSAITTETVDFF